MRLRLASAIVALSMVSGPGPVVAQQTEHVPPAPPQSELPHLSYSQMTAMMQMDDRKLFGRVHVKQLEWLTESGDDAYNLEIEASYGGDYNKLWLRLEGEHAIDREHGNVEAYWDRVLSPWWNLQLGTRHDIGDGPTRNWFALGVHGLAPYWVELAATAYVGEHSRTAWRIEADHDVLLTQHLVLQPAVKILAYGKTDPALDVGAGLANIEVGLRLRYQLQPNLAPYLGIRSVWHTGRTAELVDDSREIAAAVGFNGWF